MCIGFILFGIPSAIVAYYKGFMWGRWLIAFGLIGLIVVCCLPSASANGISPEESAARAVKANKIGHAMAMIWVTLTVISLLVLFIIYAANN